MPGVHRIDLVGQEVIACDLGVTSQCISNWYKRQDESGVDWGMPKPTLIQFRPGKVPQKAWREAQRPLWKKWHAKHLEEQGDHIPARNRRD